MASITFSDSLSTITLTNLKPFPGNRFTNWEPEDNPVGPRVHALGTGILHKFAFRTDYIVQFELRMVPDNQLQYMLRLQAHLRNGGTVSLDTNDAAGRTYPTCCLAEDGDVTIGFADSAMLEYTMTFRLLNAATPAVPFIISYTPPVVPGSDNPLEIDDIMLWYKQDSLIGYSEDDPVTFWEDSSGNGLHGIPSNPGDQGIYKENVINSLIPVVQFGHTQLESTGPLPSALATGRTMFALMRRFPDPFPLGSDGDHRFCGFGAQSSWRIGDVDFESTNLWDWARKADDTFSHYAIGVSPWHLLTMHATASAGQAYFDAVATGAPFDPNDQLFTASEYFVNGNASVGGSNPAGQHAEHIVYNRALTTEELASVHNYFNVKYSLGF